MPPYSTPTKTVADVIRTVQRQFGDESGVQLADADIAGWINDAQMQINIINKVLRAKGTLPSVANQKSYSLATLTPKPQQIEALHYNGVRVPNMPFPQYEETVTQADPNSTQTAAIPVMWTEWAGTFLFWPAPRDVQTIEVYYTAQPTVLAVSPVVPANLLSLPDDCFQDVVRYVLQQAYEMDEDWTASNTKAQQLADSLTLRGEKERTEQDMTFQTVTVVDDDSYYPWG